MKKLFSKLFKKKVNSVDTYLNEIDKQIKIIDQLQSKYQ